MTILDPKYRTFTANPRTDIANRFAAIRIMLGLAKTCGYISSSDLQPIREYLQDIRSLQQLVAPLP
jgi:hypothetical protein